MIWVCTGTIENPELILKAYKILNNLQLKSKYENFQLTPNSIKKFICQYYDTRLVVQWLVLEAANNIYREVSHT
jgi:hypothetical protein